jgi:TRAP-type C4-dicarboxylate transport system substrate-binding protein
MNKTKYDSLPADLKAVIDKNSGREFSAFLGATQEGNDVPSRKVFADTKTQTISVIPPAELDRWKKATAEQDDEWVESMNKRGLNGAALLKEAQDLVKQYTK